MKNQFHTDAFEEEKAEFLKTWFQVGCRNKKIYIDAFLNTTLGFWYPDVEDEYLEFVCFDIQKDDPHYPHVQMEPKSGWLNLVLHCHWNGCVLPTDSHCAGALVHGTLFLAVGAGKSVSDLSERI